MAKETKKQKLLPKSRLVKQDTADMDTVKYQKKMHQDKSLNVLFVGMQYWTNLDKFRRDRERNKKYCYGDQWQDRIPNPDTGGTMSEEEYIKKQGSIPLKNNLIRRLINNVCGVYLSQDKSPICKARDRQEQTLSETMSQALECNWELNGMSEMNSFSFEEFLISGMIVHRKSYEWRGERADCWTDYVNPNYFFCDGNIRRSDAKDASCIGEIHDITFGELCQKFAKTAEDYQKLKMIYGNQSNRDMIATMCERFGYPQLHSYDYFVPKDPQLCRVIEIWRKESKPRYRCVDYLAGEMFKIEEKDYNELVKQVNEDRKAEGIAMGMSEDDIPLIEAEWVLDEYWYYRFLTPFGDVLDEGESPYDHKEHPYVCKFYPFIDGEIHSFVGDVVDQQRYVNRLITLYDWIMRSSVKSAVYAPEDCLPDGMSWEDFAEQVTKVGGLVRYKVRPHGQVPQQVSSNSTNIGISDLLNIQLKFFEDISGVNGALQGKPGYSQVSGVLYAQQTQNATTSLMRLMQAFSAFSCECAKKDVKNIQQYYTTKRYIDIAGREQMSLYDPAQQQDIDYDIKITEAQNSPTMRAASNEFLIEIWRQQQISLEQLLECGDFPFADRLLENIKTKQQQMQAQQEQMRNGQMTEEELANSQQAGGTPLDKDIMQEARDYARKAAVDQGYSAGNAADRGYKMLQRAAAV